MRNVATVFAFVLVLTGCASLGLAPADSFDTKLAYAYSTHTGVLQAAAISKLNGSITKAEAEQVAALADQSKMFLDSARAVETTNPTGAQNNLTLALAVLNQLQSYLSSQGGKP